MRFTLHLLTLLLLATVNRALADEGVPLHGESRVHFANEEQGVKAWAANDRFLSSMSRFDVESRLRKQGGTRKELVQLITSQVRPWTDEDREKLSGVIADIQLRMKPYSLPFPKTVLLIHTTGKEEGQAAYCRGNAVVLPSRKLKDDPAKLRRLLLHELFHVLSNQNPEWRARMYAIVGFRPCPDIALPDDWKDRKLTNPDAPKIDNLIEVTIADRKLTATPVLLASVERYDPVKGGSFFRYLQFRLMEVEKSQQGYQPVLKDGKAILHKSTDALDFLRQIGENTKYIIHPDEILADNFAILLNGQGGDVPTPRVLKEL